MTKLEMVRAIMKPKNRGQEMLCEKYARERDKYEITLRYEQMLRREAKEQK